MDCYATKCPHAQPSHKHCMEGNFGREKFVKSMATVPLSPPGQ